MSEISKKVLVLMQYLSPGGIEWMVAHLTDGLNSNQVWQPLVFVYDHNGIEPIDSFFVSKKISFQRVQKNPGFSFLLVVKVFQLVRKQKVSVIHVHHLGALMIGVFVKLLTLNKLKIVYTQHSFIHLSKYPRYRLFEKLFTYFANELTVVSEQVKNEFLSLHISNRESDLIPNGSAFPKSVLDELAQIKNQRQSLLADEGITQVDAAENWILYLGRIHSGKGQDQALRVWNALRPEVRQSSQLIFVGPAPDFEFLASLRLAVSRSADSERIFIIGATLQASRWMQLSHVFMSSSESEGWPMAILEALGAGTPALLSNIQGHQMYRNWASFYDLSQPAEGALKLEALLELQSSTEKFTSFRRDFWANTHDLRQQFSIEKMVKNYERIYEQ